MVSWQSQSVPLGNSLLGEMDLRDVDALDLARLETLVNAWPRGAALDGMLMSGGPETLGVS